ncbi:protein kinase [Thermomonospora sp. CIF 1]|uniref:serine/threonine protein kinase n=1 Tax=Thermomonospora sp. CIF 1 TaxID=1916083 RepID=UPI000A4642A6|nr:protein kinase [Thermomonospora sp. CIF 1]PKK15788.1 MAG: hypothetical protein BUE48_003835 [Thermomonospora sp. CIF 1]
MREAAPLRPEDPEFLGGFRLTGRREADERGVSYLGEGPSGEPVVVRTLSADLLGGGRGGATATRAPAVARQAAALRQIPAARRVDSPWTARVLAADLEAEPPYVVSEHVAGPTLRQVVERHGPRTGSSLHRLANGTIQGLAAVHRAGLVHGAFGPDLVVLGQDGPRLVDFALGAVAGGRERGPAFQAPERLGGAEATFASDVFAWAATMVFAAGGRPPFGPDDDPATATRVLHHQPDLRALPEYLQKIVLRCLAKDPRRRPSAAEVAAWLQHPGRDAPADAAPPAENPAGTPEPHRRDSGPMPAVAPAPSAKPRTPKYSTVSRRSPAPAAGGPEGPGRPAAPPAAPGRPHTDPVTPPQPAHRTNPAGSSGTDHAASAAPAMPDRPAGPEEPASADRAGGPVGYASQADPTGPAPGHAAGPGEPASADRAGGPVGYASQADPAGSAPGHAAGAGEPASADRVTDPAGYAPRANAAGAAEPASRTAGSAPGPRLSVPEDRLVASAATSGGARMRVHETSGIQVTIRGRASGRRDAPRRTGRRNGLLAGLVAVVVLAGGALVAWKSGLVGGSAEAPTQAQAAPHTGPPVEISTIDGQRYRLAAIGSGVSPGAAPTGGPSKDGEGAAYVYAEYLISNLMNKPVPLDLYAVDLFIKRDLLPERSRGLCMWHNGVPEDMCTPPAKPHVMFRLAGGAPVSGAQGGQYMPPGASYVVRVTLDVPLRRDPGAGELGLYVWKQMYMTSALAQEVPFPR